MRDVYAARHCRPEGILHEVYLLVGAPKRIPDDAVPAPIGAVDGLWRSALVPGWGQLHKGESAKGWSLLAGTVGTATGGLLLQELAQRDYADAAAARTRPEKNHFLDRGDAFHTGSLVLLGAAGILYVYNLLDAGLTRPRVQYFE